MRTVRRWRHTNGIVYEEETEITRMNAGSGGKREQEELRPAGVAAGTAGGAAAGASAAAAGAAGMGGGGAGEGEGAAGQQRRGGYVFWGRQGGGFRWDWRRRA